MRARVVAVIVGLALIGGFACKKKKEKASSDEAKKKKGAMKKEKTADKKGAAEKEKKKEKKEDDKAGDSKCKSVATHVVNLMVDELGDKSMLQKKDIPTLADGCKKTKSPEKNAKAVKCLKEAKSQKDLKKCKKGNELLKTWLEKGSAEGNGGDEKEEGGDKKKGEK